MPFVVRVSDAGIVTLGPEDLVIEAAEPEVGRAVCLESGGRLAFRRVLAVSGKELRLRADVAPFEDRWSDEIVGCVRPRWVDRFAAIDPEHFTRASWRLAVASAHARSTRGRLVRTRRVAFATRVLGFEEWPRVRAFWRDACGKELPLDAQPRQQVIGLFDGSTLVGANIHLLLGTTSYSAYTLVDRRYRGSGGGSKMIEHAVAHARTQRLDSIYVHINARNLPSIGAYVRAGFTRRGWWADASDPMASAERQWLVFEIDLKA